MIRIYDEKSFMSLWLEKYFVFNVALQHLGPIDQNCVLFVGAFDL